MPAPHESMLRPPDGREMQLPVEELRRLGAVLALSGASEMLTPQGLKTKFGFENRTKDSTAYVAGRSLEFFSARVEQGALWPAQVQRAQELLREMGVVILPNALPAAVVDAMRERTLSAVRAKKYPFSTIVENEHRKDIPLEFDSGDAAADADVRAWLEATARLIAPVLRGSLGGDSELSEFAGLVSFPGAKRQRAHSDTTMGRVDEVEEDALLFSVFVSLDDTTVDMAALDVWPGTHTHWHFSGAKNSLRAGITSAPALRCALPKGSVVIMNSRTRHCGSANTSPRSRPVAYISLLEARGKNTPRSSTFTMLHRYRGRVTLDALTDGSYTRRQYDENNTAQALYTGDRKMRNPEAAATASGQLAVRITGAGSRDVNGLYRQISDHNGAHRFLLQREGQGFELFRVKKSSWWNIIERNGTGHQTKYGEVVYGSKGGTSDLVPPRLGWDEHQGDDWLGVQPDPTVQTLRIGVLDMVDMVHKAFKAVQYEHLANAKHVTAQATGYEYAVNVTGAGSTDVDGIYLASGIHNGARQYEMRAAKGHIFSIFKVSARGGWWNLFNVTSNQVIYGAKGPTFAKLPPGDWTKIGDSDWPGLAPGPADILAVRVDIRDAVDAAFARGSSEEVVVPRESRRRRRRRRARHEDL